MNAPDRPGLQPGWREVVLADGNVVDLYPPTGPRMAWLSKSSGRVWIEVEVTAEQLRCITEWVARHV